MTCTCHDEHTAVIAQIKSGVKIAWVNHPDDCEVEVVHHASGGAVHTTLRHRCEWTAKNPAGAAVRADEMKGRLPEKDGIYAVAFDGNKVTYTEVDHDDGASTEDS